MRINKYIAQATGISRRAADNVLQQGRVEVNRQVAQAGQNIDEGDQVTLDGKPVTIDQSYTTIILNKPTGYVVSREGQGSKTVYDLLPENLHQLKPVGRLDKDSSGLLLLTNDGQLANHLTHPRYQKTKVYELQLDKPLQPKDRQAIAQNGVHLEDGLSRFSLEPTDNSKQWVATLQEGRNRQIRRTFAALGYEVKKLHRTKFGDYQLPAELTLGEFNKFASNI